MIAVVLSFLLLFSGFAQPIDLDENTIIQNEFLISQRLMFQSPARLRIFELDDGFVSLDIVDTVRLSI